MAVALSSALFGNIGGGPSSISLNDLSNVNIISPAQGDFLTYNSTTSEWDNTAPSTSIYGYLKTNLTSSNGVALTKTDLSETVNISLSLSTSGDATGSVSGGVLPITLASVNANTGTFGSTSAIPVITVDAKGRITSVSTASLAGSITIGTTSIALGGTATTLAGLTSVTSTGFTGSLSGNASSATSATRAENLAGGAAGSISYQTASNTSAFLDAGTTSQVLVGGTTPSWSNTPTLTGTNFSGIPNAALTNASATIGSTAVTLGGTVTALGGLTSVTATNFYGTISKATNIAGGTAGGLPYQTAADTTTFLAAGTDGYVLTLASGAPTWAAAPVSLPSQTGNNGKYLTTDGATASWATVSASTATNLSGGATGSLPYQSGSGTTTFLAAGTNGYVLTLAAGVPTWAAAAGSSLPSQTGNGGKLLTTDGTNASWSSTLNGTLNFGTNYTEFKNTATASASTTLDCSTANNFVVAMNASVTTLSFTNIPATGRLYTMTLFLQQDATGSRTVTWPAAVKWSAGVAPTLTTTATKTDIISLTTFDGGTTWYGFIGGLNY